MHRGRRSNGRGRLRWRRDWPGRLGLDCYFGRLCRRFRVRKLAKMFSGQLGMLDIERAGMCLFLRDADLREKIDQHLGLDLKLSRQFVDTDLIGI